MGDVLKFAGKGNRKPQLDVDITLVQLDNDNPRLVPYLENRESATQLDLLSVLHDHFDTEVIALSLINNGYFDEEPIIIVPKSLPKDFSFSNFSTPDETGQEIQKLIDAGEIEFTVVEGNRRTSAIKLLTQSEYRKQLDIDSHYPKVEDKDIIADISKVPCIIYENRDDVSAYLGVRHIGGLLKWEAFAQAAYTASIIDSEKEQGSSVQDAIKKVQKIVGDRSDKLKKQYVTYKLFIEARDNLGFNVRPIINKFSLLTVAYNSAKIREYLGVESYSKVDLSDELITSDKHEELKNVLTWIYGNIDTSEQPVLTDSRKITNTLSHIVDSPEAVQYLMKYKDIEGAYEMTSGEREYLSKKLLSGTRAIQTSLKFAYKYKGDEELLIQVEELEELVSALKENLTVSNG